MTDDSKRDDPKRDALGALHEVSNALTVLLGWVAEARDPSAAPEDVKQALRIVEQRARAARDLARRAIGAKVPPPGDAEIDALLAEVAESLRLEAERVQVKIACSGDGHGCRIPLGEDLAQIVTNLALNAFAFAPKGSELRIIVSVAPREVTVDVQDEGPGLTGERTFTVFEGDTTRQGGAGVGLRHARAMARAAGGDLQLLETLGTQTGATFRVSWPRDVPTSVGEPRASRPKLQILAGTRILIVEDDRDVTTLLESALEARGAEVTIAHTAEELAARIASDHTAVLVDLSPIADDVAGALAMVKRQAKDAAIVFITGSAEALPEGMENAAWVRKPFEVGELVTILSKVTNAKA
ncbi:MAG TPA: ATP-binding protein [Polyangiaceae bacterium]|jgi:CheY-like chemotaxis protein|nr:ATP-binding protein [Polyangiaceae bacterium]